MSTVNGYCQVCCHSKEMAVGRHRVITVNAEENRMKETAQRLGDSRDIATRGDDVWALFGF